MTKHTPGPWRVGISKREPDTLAIYCGPEINGGGCYVAHIEGRAEMANPQANANLFAAAPELLELLEIFVEGTCRHPEHDIHAEAKMVIAKAKGETP